MIKNLKAQQKASQTETKTKTDNQQKILKFLRRVEV